MRLRRARARGMVCPAVAACVAIAAGVAGAYLPPPHLVLQERLGLSTDDLSALDRGRIVVKPLPIDDRREIGALGAVKIAVPVGFFVARLDDIVTFKQSAFVKQIGKFSDPPRLEDLAALTLDAVELEALRKCRPGDCGLQLSAEQIRRIQTEIDWSAPDATATATRLVREMLFDYVQAYRTSGNRVLLEYRRDEETVKVLDTTRSLVDHSAQMLGGAPEFSAYLMGSSRQELPRTCDFIYWSKEQFGLKPVISITNVIVYRPARPLTADAMIASKQIYASRYFAGSLALTLGIETAGDVRSSSFYMVYSNRTRPASFPPVIGGLVRRIVQSETRSGLEENLRLTKARLEREYRSQ